jgi:2-polyprenyl-3-methyl-5-hydroxy-6-metoxy-1,4-benzoquinol methylase
VRFLDRLLQGWRITKAVAHIESADHVLDVGCHRGELFDRLEHTRITGLGIDSESIPKVASGRFEFVKGVFPDDLPVQSRPFDAVCALAVLEHVPNSELGDFINAMRESVKPGGTAILTVPSPLVDKILDVLIWLHLANGMEAEQHHGFDVGTVIPLFVEAGFSLVEHRKFQLGLNNLFVFRRSE